MHISKRSFLHINLICAGLALLLTSGCITMPVSTYTNAVAYEPVPSPVQIDASAAVEAVDTISPEDREIWKHYLNSDASIANYAKALEQMLRNDLATSGLFARIITGDATKADYVVKVECLESHPSDFRVRLTLTATETATGLPVSSHTREVSLGTSVFDVKLKDALPGLMAALKTDLVADFQAKTHRQQERVAQEEAEMFTKASLFDLLAGSDKSESLARARNRALIAAKNQQLPAMLREKKTDELSALVVKIEQTILDLNHECEIAKDRAQQSIAAAGAATESARLGRGRDTAGPTGNTPNLDELRSLAISYRERIELLKPILTALKEEIANRNR
jgi:hypothetical protein